MKILAAATCLSLGVLASAARADLVTVQFEAEASNISGQPFGLDVPHLAVVRGHFTYDSDSPDSNTDLKRGEFRLDGTWDFRAEFLDHVVTGSNRSTASTETFGFTLRFSDGGDQEETGDMAFDGVPASDITLGFSITGDTDDLPSDRLPTIFRFGGAPHTFSLGDDSGTMRLQFLSFRGAGPLVTSVSWQNHSVRVVWCSVFDRRYAVDFSTDLTGWETIRAEVVGKTGTTEILDDLLSRDNPEVPRGYYRVRELGPDPG